MGHTFNIFSFFLLVWQTVLEHWKRNDWQYCIFARDKAVHFGWEMVPCFKRVPAGNQGQKLKKTQGKMQINQSKKQTQTKDSTKEAFSSAMRVSPWQQNKAAGIMCNSSKWWNEAMFPRSNVARKKTKKNRDDTPNVRVQVKTPTFSLEWTSLTLNKEKRKNVRVRSDQLCANINIRV